MKHLSILIALIGVSLVLATTIDLNDLFNYSNQNIPNYINKDNTNGNNITNAGATLGRVLFYDKKLSVDNTVACASCHQQEFAFGDTATVSLGVNGVTGRHSMRLVNARFAIEENFFWDERADDLEEQTTMPIQDHAEMGFSGQEGAPDLNDLIVKLEEIGYYNELFNLVYGNTEITEVKIQNAIAQFIRSIQSFDSKYDQGRSQVNNDNQPFPNFSNDENEGKNLFRAPPQFDANGSRIGGGLGCNGCHNAPEFDIDPNSNSNSVIGVIGSTDNDYTITRAPTLRDLINPQGVIQPMMHTGQAPTLDEVIDIYNEVVLPGNGNNNRIDRRLRPAGNAQKLNITEDERTQLKAFLITLTGSDVYTNPKWSDPFDENGNLTILNGNLTQVEAHSKDIKVYPNPCSDYINIDYQDAINEIIILDINGSELINTRNRLINLSSLSSGKYFIVIKTTNQNIYLDFIKE